MKKIVNLVAALAVLCLGSASASAGIINFNFTNDGGLTGLGDCGANCVLLKTAGIATATGDVNQSWLFQGAMKVYSGMPDPDSPDLGWGVGSGLGWSFSDFAGNNLYGAFTAVGDILSWSGSADLSYIVLGGSGIFGGAFGTGKSFVTTKSGTFHEEGDMTVYTSVPEPGVTLLLLTALGMVGVMAYRRRRLQI